MSYNDLSKFVQKATEVTSAKNLREKRKRPMVYVPCKNGEPQITRQEGLVLIYAEGEDIEQWPQDHADDYED